MPRYTEKQQHLIFKVIKYFQLPKEAGKPLIPLTSVNQRVSDALGISLPTVANLSKNGIHSDSEYTTKMVFFLIFLIENSLGISLMGQKWKQATQALLGNCRTKTEATKEDFETLRLRKIPSTKSGLCLMECLFEGASIMENGKFNKDGMIVALTPALKGDVSKIRKLKELGKTCDSELGYKQSENCETGKRILECFAKNGNKYGLEFVNTKNLNV